MKIEEKKLSQKLYQMVVQISLLLLKLESQLE